MTKKSRKNEMQADAKASPIVENSKLPEMGEASIKGVKSSKGKGLMDDALKSEKTMTSSSGDKKGKFMAPVPEKLSGKKASTKDTVSAGEMDAQKELPKSRTKSEGEGYVSLRMRVTGDKISLIGARTVEGPLTTPEKIHSGLIYEASFEDQRIGFGWIAEAAERRSFPPPNPAPGQEGHHITELSSFEFNARITKEEFAKANLSEVELFVYRVKEEPRNEFLSTENFGEQFNRELREVAHVKGINLSKLDDAEKKELKKLNK